MQKALSPSAIEAPECLPHLHTCPNCRQSHTSLFRGDSALCPDCIEIRQQDFRLKEQAQHAAEIKQARASAWQVLCPEDYRRTDWQHHPELSQVCHWLARHWSLLSETRDPHFGPERGLLIYGPTGKGKTRAMFAILSRLHFSGVPCHAVESVSYAEDVLRSTEMRAPWPVKAAAQHALNAAKHARVLFFDDLGKEGGSPGFARSFHDLLEYRKSHRLATLITSERVGTELAQNLGTNYADGIVRRIREICAVFHTEQSLPTE